MPDSVRRKWKERAERERRADVLHRLVGLDRRSRLGAVAAVCLAELAANPVQHRVLQQPAGGQRPGRCAENHQTGRESALYKDAQDIIWKESPWVPLVVEKLVSAHNKALTGFYIMPDTGFSFDDADLK
jgi:hypothetical protein